MPISRIKLKDVWTRFRRGPKAPAIVVLMAIVFSGLQLAQVDRGLEQQLEHRFLFWARSKAKRGPGLDSRVKIFSFDDATAASEKAFDISLGDWGLVFKALGEQKPRYIVVDKIFDKPHPDQEIAAFKEIAKSWKSPVHIVSFAAATKIDYRAEIPHNRPEIQAGNLMQSGPQDFPRWLLGMKPRFFYGAVAALTDGVDGVFAGVGHAVYELDGHIQSFFKINDEVFVPHISLAAGGNLKFLDKEIYSSEKKVSTDPNGRILINLDVESVYAERAYAMGALIRRARSGKPISVINEGDVVVVLPGMYTGNTDFRESPHGSMPGGFLVTALTNSTQTGKWLQNWRQSGPPMIIGGAALGVWIAASMSPVMIGISALSALALVILLDIVIFSFAGILFPFALPATSLLLATGIMFSERSRRAQVDQVRIEGELATAQIVQNSFFRLKKPCSPDLTIIGKFVPAGECGGDWWGHYPISDTAEYIFIGDATGHGVSAALVTAVSFATISTIEEYTKGANQELPRPSLLMTMLNRVLVDLGNNTGSMTFLIGLVDLKNNKFVYCNGGHLPPALLPLNKDDSRIQGKLPMKNLTAPGNMLGIDPESNFTNSEIEIRPGDRIFLYTDGLIENQASATKAPFGKKRLAEALIANSSLPAGAFLATVFKAYAAHIVGQPPGDDTTLVVIDWKRSPDHITA